MKLSYFLQDENIPAIKGVLPQLATALTKIDVTVSPDSQIAKLIAQIFSRVLSKGIHFGFCTSCVIY